MKNLPKLIVILGPTGSGKSELAVKIAKRSNGEIINADSRQIYKEMDIGTGKISKPKDRTVRKSSLFIHGVRHHLIDAIKPDKSFTLAQYQKQAFYAIEDIIRNKKLPILVGGTGLYIRAIVDNLDIPKVAPNKRLRAKLEKESASALFQKLKKLDPQTAEAIDQHNKRRLVRALEFVLTKRSSFRVFQKTKKPRYEVLQIGLSVEREKLYRRIKKRFNQMLKNGLIEETQKLFSRYSPNLPSMSGIGYAEIGRYLRGEISLQQATELAVIRTRQYAKRQTTWFKKDLRIHWIIKPVQAQKLVSRFLSV